jgi:hypothetical protein
MYQVRPIVRASSSGVVECTHHCMLAWGVATCLLVASGNDVAACERASERAKKKA